jgi:hypothetical protein
MPDIKKERRRKSKRIASKKKERQANKMEINKTLEERE